MATNKQLMAVLGAIPLFEGLSQKQLKKLTALGQIASFMAGATIVHQGVIGDSFYVILSGQAKVVVNGRTVNRLLPGDHFGEISLLDGQERTASVVSETPMTLLEILQTHFFEMLQQDPEISVAILEGLARAVRRIDRTLAR
ncbi:MAG: cyclic nucleotide-binding domain-containing protein [Actinomycetota bacterium]